MEYTPEEKEYLALLQRTDFKHLSKNDLLSFASRLKELRPDVAKQVIAQFPELSQMIQSTLVGYKEIIEEIVSSNTHSVDQVYSILSDELASSSESRKEYYAYASKVHSDLNKLLENPNLTPDQQKDIMDRQMEVFRMVDKKDTEIREAETETTRAAVAKDTENKAFSWRLLGAASFLVLTVVGLGTAALGGKFDITLPNKQ